TYGRIHSPGNSPYVITVGATNSHQTAARSDDSIATYSSRGPTRSSYTDENGQQVYDNLIKPDIVAPGNKIVSYNAPNNLIGQMHPELNTADAMLTMSGTSMSTPEVSGAAALLLEVNPNLTPAMIKTIIQYSAQPLAGADMFEQGAGQLNIEGAVRIANSLKSDAAFQNFSLGWWIRSSGSPSVVTNSLIAG